MALNRELLIEDDPRQTRAAVLESGRLAELYIERRAQRGQVGSLYKGRVRRVLPGMQAAFVDIGSERDAYLHVEDVPGARPADDDSSPRETRPQAVPPAIDALVCRGQELIVQVTKDGLEGKGARINAEVTLPGRFVVLTPFSGRIRISKRIADPDERERLKLILSAVRSDLGLAPGLIARTAAQGVARPELEREYARLCGAWLEIEERAAVARAPALLRVEEDLAVRVVRDRLGVDVDAARVDGPEAHRNIVGFLSRAQPELLGRVKAVAPGLFDRHRIDAALDAALEPTVALPSGGRLVIDQTEALVAIDVNTGGHVGGSDFEQTVLRTNLEAVSEAALQMRLRDLSGILIIDLIDMEQSDHREQVFARLEQELRKDRARNRALAISEFGLVQLTRQRRGSNLERLLTRACPCCRGIGRIKSVATICQELLRTCLARSRQGGDGLEVRVHPEVLDGLRGDEAEVLAGIEEASGSPVALQADPTLHREHFVVTAVKESLT